MTSAMDIIGSDEALKDHWIKRFIAIIIDYIIVAVPLTILSNFLLNWNFGLYYFSSMGIIFLLYFLITELAMGASLGKKIMKLRVIAFSGDLDIGKVVIRNISKINSFLLLIDVIVGMLTEGDPKQKYLDRIAGTSVVLTSEPLHHDQHIYQEHQYTQPPAQQYPDQNTPVYNQPPPPSNYQDQPAPPPQQASQCSSCGGSLAMTGDGRHQCIRCGRIY